MNGEIQKLYNIRITEAEEEKVKQLMGELYKCFACFLRPAMTTFLASKEITNYQYSRDPMKYLKDLKEICNTNKNPFGCTGNYKKMLKLLLMSEIVFAILIILKFCASGKAIFRHCVILCHLINAPDKGKKIKLVFDRLLNA